MTTAQHTGPTLDVSGTAPVPFWRLVHVELRKSYDTRAGFWLLVTIGILVALVEGFILVATLVQETVVYYEDYAVTASFLTSVLLPVLAIMLVTSEWTQRGAMVSFSLEPRRIRVVLAKLVVSVLLALVTLAFACLLAVMLTGICEAVQPELTGWEVEKEFFIGFTIIQLCNMLIGFAIAALLLNTPAAIVLYFGYWYLLPTILAAVGGINDGLGDVLEWLNFRLATFPLLEWKLDTAEEIGKLVVSGTFWMVLPLVLGVVRILRTEVK
jgi:ABC-2 type transport system permease protein